MANKEQCLRCKGYNPEANLCTIKWTQPSFDGNNCDKYNDSVTNKQVMEPCQQDEMSSENIQSKEEPAYQIKKRRAYSKGMSLYVRGSKNPYRENGDGNNKSLPKSVIEIPDKYVRIAGVIIIILVVLAIGYGGFNYIRDKKKQEIEDIVWKARTEMDLFTSDKTVEYLRLYKTEYDDGFLNLYFLRNLSIINKEEQVTDSTMIDDIVSFVSINPSIWDSACTVLENAAVDLSIIYSDVNIEKRQGLEKPKITIPHTELRKKLLSDAQRERGLDLFVKRKTKEVRNYAFLHFRNDILFKVDSVGVYNHYVSLHLSYDDRKAKLGKSYLDTAYVNAHYTDPVGEMGSILDGMLTICSRVNMGVAFEYVGRNSKKRDVWAWDAEKTKKLIDGKSKIVHLSGQKTNQVHTVIIKNRH